MLCWFLPCEYECVCHSVMSNSLQPHGLQPTRLLCPWDSSGKNTRVSCHFFLQRIFPTRNQTRVSRIVGRFFTVWATRDNVNLCPFLLKPPSHPLFHPTPLGLSQSPGLSSVCWTQQLPMSYLFCTWQCLCFSATLVPPSPSIAVSGSLISVCVSIPALQIGSSVPFF